MVRSDGFWGVFLSLCYYKDMSLNIYIYRVVHGSADVAPPSGHMTLNLG